MCTFCVCWGEGDQSRSHSCQDLSLHGFVQVLLPRLPRQTAGQGAEGLVSMKVF